MDVPIHFKRAALIVADLERSLSIYRDALGFRVQSIKVSDPDSYSREIFGIDPQARLRMAALDGSPGQDRTLALLEVVPPLPPATNPVSAIVLMVADLETAIARLAAVEGVRMFAPRALHTHDGREGKEIAAIDPDGHGIILYHV